MRDAGVFALRFNARALTGRLAENPWPAPFSEVDLSALPGCGDGVDAPIRLIRAPEV